MSDPPVEGSSARPVGLDPFQNITAVGWGGAIGMLVIDFPDLAELNVAPSSSLSPKSAGAVIARADLPAAVDFVPFDSPNPILLRKLTGSKNWRIDLAFKLPGPDPGPLLGPNPFGHEGDPFIVLNEFAHNLWINWATNIYPSTKAEYDGVSGRRWVEVADVTSLSDDDTYMTDWPFKDAGKGQKYTWEDFPFYGAVDDHYYQYEDAHTTTFFGGFEQYDIVLITGDTIPGNLASQNWGAEAGFAFAPANPVLWGLGEVQSGSGANLIRQIYLIDTAQLKTDLVTITNFNSKRDDDLGEFAMTFTLSFYPAQTKFTRGADALAADQASTSSAQKTASYYQSGQLFQFGSKGFV